MTDVTGGLLSRPSPRPSPAKRERGTRPLFVFAAVSEGCLGCGQSCYWDSEGAAAYVVQAQFVAEMDRVWVSPMLAADSDLHLRARLPALGDRHRHEAAHAAFVDRLERVARQDLVLEVAHDEVALGVVAPIAERHVREVVGAEGEEFRDRRYLARREGLARYLAHAAELLPPPH